MQHFCKFLFICVLFSASAFSQDIGIIQCDSDSETSVPAWIAPGKPQVVSQLSCGQMVTVTAIGRFAGDAQYSSRPSRYAQIQIGDNVAYVDARYVRILDSQEALKIRSKKKEAPVEKPPSPKEEEQKKWDLIKRSDVTLRDEDLLDPMYTKGPRTFVATINNQSEYPISHLRMLVRLYDCAGRPDGNYSNCEIIGEVEPVVSAPVPAGQTRKCVATMLFKDTPRIKNRFDWGYKILGIRAE